MSDFNRKIAIVTGATGNLGSAIVQAFAEQGASVALVDLNAERLDAACAALGEPARFKGFTADLSSADDVTRLIADISAAFGRIDILAHTVGGYAAGQPVHEAGLDVLHRMMNLNVVPLYLMGGAVAKQMIAQGGGGKIVFVLAKSGLKGIKNQAAYTASKGAAFRIMEAMAAELREHGIAVNGVSPSIMDTPANRASMPNADPSNWVTTEQVARAILYLAHADSNVYGTNLEVYGKSF